MAYHNGHICKVSYLCEELYVGAAHFFYFFFYWTLGFLANVNSKMIF